ncbi:MAG: tetratricopeptide repeat protein [Spongiibacteraceae bacterium]|nr:tetratricopeptide repeat protein [Spongiibacteraceae bacterium]
MLWIANTWRRAAVVIVCVTGVAACASRSPATAIPAPEPAPVTVAPAPASTPPARAWSRADQIAELLALAEAALGQDRLLTPEDDAAFTYYRDVLRLDSANPAAHAGMRRITARYFQLAESQWRAGNIDEAERMLARAQQVAATPGQVARLKAGWPVPRRPDNSFPLDTTALTARGAARLARLGELARRAETADSRLLIVARNDAEGRWIYQQMRDVVPGYRLRGNIEIGARPRVVLIDLDP